MRRGQDANWDLQNYDYYTAWAWLHDRRAYATDSWPRSCRRFTARCRDLPFHLTVDAGWDPRAISVALAVPAGIEAFVLHQALPLLFADLPRAKRWASVASRS